MKRIAQEAEVIARLDFLTNETHITVVSWPTMARRMKRLYGKPFDARGQVQRWKVEGLPVTFRKPHKYAVLVPAGALKRGFSKVSAATRVYHVKMANRSKIRKRSRLPRRFAHR